MKDIKVIIFDVDGQVIFSHGYFSEIYFTEKKGNLDVIRNFFKKKWVEVVTGRLDLKEELEKIVDKWGISDSVEGYLRKWFEHESDINNRVIHLVESLKKDGVICVLATNNEKYRVQYLLDDLRFSEIFDHVYASGHLGSRKPEQDFFSQIYTDLFKKYSIAKEEVLFCDDTLENIQGAEVFGFKVHHYNDFDKFVSSLSD